MADERKAKKKTDDLMKRLKEIGFTQIELSPISAGYWEHPIALYYNRDLIDGRRIRYFTEYAEWFRDAV